MRSHRIRVHPKTNKWCLSKKRRGHIDTPIHREERDVMMEAETGLMQM